MTTPASWCARRAFAATAVLALSGCSPPTPETPPAEEQPTESATPEQAGPPASIVPAAEGFLAERASTMLASLDANARLDLEEGAPFTLRTEGPRSFPTFHGLGPEAPAPCVERLALTERHEDLADSPGTDRYRDLTSFARVEANAPPVVRWRTLDSSAMQVEVRGVGRGGDSSTTGWLLEFDGARWHVRALALSLTSGRWLPDHEPIEQAVVTLSGSERSLGLRFEVSTAERMHERRRITPAFTVTGRVRIDLSLPSAEPPAQVELGAAWFALRRAGLAPRRTALADPVLVEGPGPALLVGSPRFGPLTFRPLGSERLGDSVDLSGHESEAPERHVPQAASLPGGALFVRTPWHGDWTEPTTVEFVLRERRGAWTLDAAGVFEGCDVVGGESYVPVDRLDLESEPRGDRLGIRVRAAWTEADSGFEDLHVCEFEVPIDPDDPAPESAFLDRWRELEAARAGR